MEAGKFMALFEHGLEGEDKVSRQALCRICRMYLSGDGPDGLEKACEKAVKESSDPDELRDAIIAGSGEATKALQKLLAENTVVEESKPVSSALSKLMDEDLADDDDEDDEDEDGEEGTKEKKQKIQPVMRGLLKLEEGKLIWSGKWAYSKEAFDKGDKHKFKCTFVDKSSKELSVKNPPNGKYAGYFLLPEGDSQVKVPEKENILKFGEKADNGWIAVEGKGKNKFGDFSMSGMYDPKSGRLSLVKAYKTGSDEYEDEGESDDESGMEDDDPEDAAAELEDLKADAEQDIRELIKRKQEIEDADRKKKKQKK